MTHQAPSDYDNVTPLEWAEYEFATIEYDHKISPDAARGIRAIMQRLSERTSEQT